MIGIVVSVNAIPRRELVLIGCVLPLHSLGIGARRSILCLVLGGLVCEIDIVVESFGHVGCEWVLLLKIIINCGDALQLYSQK